LASEIPVISLVLVGIGRGLYGIRLIALMVLSKSPRRLSAKSPPAGNSTMTTERMPSFSFAAVFFIFVLPVVADAMMRGELRHFNDRAARLSRTD
jgi:hypothetical protein